MNNYPIFFVMQTILGYSRKYPHIPHGRHWKSYNKCSVSPTGLCKFHPNFWNFDQNSRKFIEVLQKSGIPQNFESAGSGILHKLLLSILEILKFLGTQFSVVHWGGVDIFWNSPFAGRGIYSKKGGTNYKV